MSEHRNEIEGWDLAEVIDLMCVRAALDEDDPQTTPPEYEARLASVGADHLAIYRMDDRWMARHRELAVDSGFRATKEAALDRLRSRLTEIGNALSGMEPTGHRAHEVAFVLERVWEYGSVEVWVAALVKALDQEPALDHAAAPSTVAASPLREELEHAEARGLPEATAEVLRRWLAGGLNAIRGNYCTAAECLASLGESIAAVREMGQPQWAAVRAATAPPREIPVIVRAADGQRSARVIQERLTVRDDRLCLEVHLSFGTTDEGQDLVGCAAQILAADLQRPLDADVTLTQGPITPEVTTRPAGDAELVEVRIRADLADFLGLDPDDSAALAEAGVVPFAYRVLLTRPEGEVP
jgi:hypothetical protein